MLKKYPASALKEVPPSPAQKRQVELFLAVGSQIINDQKWQAGLMEKIKSQDPIDAIATSTLAVIDRLDDMAQERGEKLDPDAELQASNVIMGQIIAIYEKNGGAKLNDEQKYQAFSLAVSMYLDEAVKTGKISKEELAKLSEMMQQTPEGKKIASQISGKQAPANKGILGG